VSEDGLGWFYWLGSGFLDLVNLNNLSLILRFTREEGGGGEEEEEEEQKAHTRFFAS
jgi:hypothetical protein